MRYWNQVAKRAAREARAVARLEDNARLVLAFAIPLTAGVLTWWLSGKPTLATFITVGLVMLFASSVFIWKMVTVPAEIAAEQLAQIANLETTMAGARLSADDKERIALVQGIIRLYAFEADGISPAIAAGIELPSADWINKKIVERGGDFEVKTSGSTFSIYAMR